MRCKLNGKRRRKNGKHDIKRIDTLTGGQQGK
jgi:hypothetical protein